MLRQSQTVETRNKLWGLVKDLSSSQASQEHIQRYRGHVTRAARRCSRPGDDQRCPGTRSGETLRQARRFTGTRGGEMLQQARSRPGPVQKGKPRIQGIFASLGAALLNQRSTHAITRRQQLGCLVLHIHTHNHTPEATH